MGKLMDYTEPGQAEEMDENTALMPINRNHRAVGATSVASNRARVVKLVLLLLICVLERCTFYEYAADVFNSQPNNPTHQTYCGVLGDDASIELSEFERKSLPNLAMLSLAFLLPVLGGIAADRHYGCLRTLQTGCVFYSLGAFLNAAMVYVPATCNTPCKYWCQFLLALGSGLVRPSLMTLTYEFGQPLMGTIALCHLYYAAEALGQIIGCSLAFATDLMQKPLTFTCVGSTQVMIGLAISLPHKERTGWNPSQFRLPYWPRIRRMLIVICPIILMSSVLMLKSFTIDGYELTKMSNQTTIKMLIRNNDLLLLVWSSCLLPLVAAVALLARLNATFKSRFVRLSLGIALTACSQFASSATDFWFSSWPSHRPDPEHLKYFFGFQSFLGAASEALTLIAINEVAFKIAQVEIRTFIIGLFMSLRGSGFLSALSILAIYSACDSIERAAVAHLVVGIVLILALIFYTKYAPRALRWLIEIQAAAHR